MEVLMSTYSCKVYMYLADRVQALCLHLCCQLQQIHWLTYIAPGTRLCSQSLQQMYLQSHLQGNRVYIIVPKDVPSWHCLH